MDKLKIKEAILVEGKYDKIKLSSLVEGVILEAGGFSLFHDGERLALLRHFAQSRGLVILTDSDGAGLLIRGRVHSLLPGVTVKHAYVPELAGKEKRKRQASKAGLLGVEGMSLSVLRTALERAGATLEDQTTVSPSGAVSPGLTKGDLYTLGLSGTPQSTQRRKALCLSLGLPQNISANRLLEALNGCYTKDEILESMATTEHLTPCAIKEDSPYGADKKTD